MAAAGNFGDTTPTWPAAFRRVVSVGALTADLRPSAFSSRGWWVDCSAIGEGVLSTYVEGEQSPDFTEDPESVPGRRVLPLERDLVRSTRRSPARSHDSCTSAACPPARPTSQLLATGRPMPDFGQTFDILPGV